MRLYRLVIKRRPNCVPAYVNLGVILYRQGDKTGGVSVVREARRIDSLNAIAWYNLARMYCFNGENDSARLAIERVCRLAPQDMRF